MIGRAAATNPWIFSQMQQFAATGRYDLPADEDRYRLLSGYYRQITAANLPDGVGKMKQFACWFTHGVVNGTELRRIVHAARTPSEVLDSVERFFSQRPAGAMLSSAPPIGKEVLAENSADCDAAAGNSVAEVFKTSALELPVAKGKDPAHGSADFVQFEAALGT